MSIERKKTMHRPPLHPGEILRETFMVDYDVSVAELAELMDVSRQSVNAIVREKRAVSPEMAIRLAVVFGTTADLWLNMQRDVDLYEARRKLAKDLRNIHSLASAAAVL